jgi:hypothetical protein
LTHAVYVPHALYVAVAFSQPYSRPIAYANTAALNQPPPCYTVTITIADRSVAESTSQWSTKLHPK